MDDLIFLTRKEAAKYLKLDIKTLELWGWKKINLRFYKIGHQTRYRKDDLDQFILSGEVNIKS